MFQGEFSIFWIKLPTVGLLLAEVNKDSCKISKVEKVPVWAQQQHDVC